MTTSTTIDVAARVADVIQGHRDRLVALSHAVHAHAELAFDEHQSAAELIAVLDEAGFQIDKGVGGLPTAFTATRGTGDLVIGICAEYDALPEVGHACGHNLIAASAVGAALGLAEIVDDLGITVKLIGTPAEEHGGGKVLLLEAGVFDDLTCAMMIHPATVDAHPSVSLTQGVGRYVATFTGKASHAAAAPQDGINAADAAVVTQVAIGLLRQQLPASARIGLFVRDGGQATNIIPERVLVDFEVREFDVASQEALRERVFDCFRAGALATGCTVEFELTEPEYEPVRQDARLGEPFAAAMVALGRAPQRETPLTGGSTDMGNVSQYLPSIHPIVAVQGSDNPPHTRGFADDVITPASEDTLVDGAAAMAATAVAVAQDPVVRAQLRDEQNHRPAYTARRTR